MYRISFYLRTCNQAWLIGFAALVAVGVYALGSVADPTLWRNGGTDPKQVTAINTKPATFGTTPGSIPQPSFQLPVPVQTTLPHN